MLLSKKRGHNVVAIDEEGSIIKTGAFDTWGQQMANFITTLPEHTVVLISVVNSGDNFVDDAPDALRSLGATEPLKPGWRESWLLVGYKGPGEKPSWIRQDSKKRSFGPTNLALAIQICH